MADPVAGAQASAQAHAVAGAQTAGAQSVAEAVKRVADAAVAEIQKVKAVQAGDFRVSGEAGGRFTIRGAGFGASGTVKVNGVQCNTLSWSTTQIEGWLPAGVGPGEVVVQIDEKTSQRGHLAL